MAIYVGVIKEKAESLALDLKAAVATGSLQKHVSIQAGLISDSAGFNSTFLIWG